jgi:hypothetical protein
MALPIFWASLPLSIDRLQQLIARIRNQLKIQPFDTKASIRGLNQNFSCRGHVQVLIRLTSKYSQNLHEIQTPPYFIYQSPNPN